MKSAGVVVTHVLRALRPGPGAVRVIAVVIALALLGCSPAPAPVSDDLAGAQSGTEDGQDVRQDRPDDSNTQGVPGTGEATEGDSGDGDTTDGDGNNDERDEEPPVFMFGGPSGGIPGPGPAEDLGSHPLGRTSPPLDITYENWTDSPLRLDDVSTEAPFAIVRDGCRGERLPADDSCTVSVTFTPTGPGTATRAVQARVTHLCGPSATARACTAFADEAEGLSEWHVTRRTTIARVVGTGYRPQAANGVDGANGSQTSSPSDPDNERNAPGSATRSGSGELR